MTDITCTHTHWICSEWSTGLLLLLYTIWISKQNRRYYSTIHI